VKKSENAGWDAPSLQGFAIKPGHKSGQTRPQAASVEHAPALQPSPTRGKPGQPCNAVEPFTKSLIPVETTNAPPRKPTHKIFENVIEATFRLVADELNTPPTPEPPAAKHTFEGRALAACAVPPLLEIPDPPPEFPPCPECGATRYWISRSKVMCGSRTCRSAVRFVLTQIEYFPIN
jgi:hypothetical protein